MLWLKIFRGIATDRGRLSHETTNRVASQVKHIPQAHTSVRILQHCTSGHNSCTSTTLWLNIMNNVNLCTGSFQTTSLSPSRACIPQKQESAKSEKDPL
eukprot:1353721-Amphidinium_carterae.1